MSFNLKRDISSQIVASSEKNLKAKLYDKLKLDSKIAFSNVVSSSIYSVNMYIYMVVWKDYRETPGLLHFTLSYIFIGLPIMYFQVLMGQYSKLGPIHVYKICPILFGIGYTMIFSMFVKCISFGIQQADLLIYALTTFRTKLRYVFARKKIKY